MNRALISIESLSIGLDNQTDRLVDTVNLQINKGECVCLIGESGSGKSLTARALLGLLPSKMPAEGQIIYDGIDLLALNKKERRAYLGKKIGIIFQDYRGSFTPYIRLGKQMVETISTHLALTNKQAKTLAKTVLTEMGLDEERIYASYPFQLSGGQIQRVAISLALALKPGLIICDEITTALDVISGERVLSYIEKLRKETGCAVLMITHDLAQAYKHADRIYVMEKGKIVESGLAMDVRYAHQHPYTKKLCESLLALPGEQHQHSPDQVVLS